MSNQPIEAVLFDVGGVLLDGGEPRGRATWQQRLGLADGELERVVWAAIGSRGAAEYSTIVAAIAVETGLSEVDAGQLLEDFHAHWRPVPELLGFLRRLRSSYKVGIIANVGSAGRFAFERVLGLSELSDVMVLSAEAEVEKPHPAIYLLTADCLGVLPERCLFVDDLIENVEGARAVGMRAMHHMSAEGTIAQLRSELKIATSPTR